jgi:hypothetical protein
MFVSLSSYFRDKMKVISFSKPEMGEDLQVEAKPSEYGTAAQPDG